MSQTAHTVTSEDDSEMAYSLGKCHHVKSMFQSHVSLLLQLNYERDICPHTPRGQKKNIKQIVDSLLGHSIFGCLKLVEKAW